ncbi:CO/xanthine dehydrogenase FAD-binding subunit [Clostridium tetanomorphum]|uniref:FAD-binding protein n=1 Tax=Clostridium tetanomorphum TaxID=1553 RepID=A0A923EBD9_CLOTT|nr:FAD binding domain-containing protein [Clostridium tetanomorphum]KAJ51901.1 FAD-binding subunit of oxidoreductase [Clostridium tetanomorphum DSM 665]MBC2398629.1 FAD-binding protein [Clostridium tetanomorphum]MBP1864094.1 CO/xanthine dehydrogenase FAD-binding subunit [Clostridium tetanomorphum]NRS84507.1 CO/xanthine dehydrogenase FAD-binding subunit [Clostridium tetanomorphum]NRZ97721.1 CO/xanthine dehydrogenase FAD-binding subunit [Clostridium tetanomorphum]
MFTITELVQPQTIEEAYSILISRRSNTVLGGCAFLKMGKKSIGTGIDLSKLNLNYIIDEKEYIKVGAGTTFRDLEVSSIINNNFNGALCDSVKNIIGVQFRNIVTVGGTVFSKYGFSDLITALLALDTEVELYKGGRMSLEDFLVRPYEKDILCNIYLKKNRRKAVYKSFRNSLSDYAILNVAVSELNNQWKVVVGAKPMVASIAKNASKLLSKEGINQAIIEKAAKVASQELSFGSNMRASSQYRKAICNTLIKRAIMEVIQCR